MQTFSIHFTTFALKATLAFMLKFAIDKRRLLLKSNNDNAATIINQLVVFDKQYKKQSNDGVRCFVVVCRMQLKL